MNRHSGSSITKWLYLYVYYLELQMMVHSQKERLRSVGEVRTFL